MTRFVSVFTYFAILILALSTEAQGLKTTRNKNYSKPVYFDILGPNKAQMNPILEYDLTQNEGRSLKLGAITIDEKSFAFGYKKLRDIDPTVQDVKDVIFFTANWPDFLFPEAKLELLSRDGKVLWVQEINKTALEVWRAKIASAFKSNKATPLKSLEWAMEASSAALPLDDLADGFRFCISRLRTGSQERLCSQRYVIRKVGTQSLLGRLKTLGSPRVLINGEVAPLKGEREAVGPIPIRFFAELVTGETLEFSSKPLNVVWSDFTKVEGTNLVRVAGYDTPPIGQYQILNPDKNPAWVEAIGFESTIYDPRKFWAVSLKEDESYVYFPGEEGGVFKHPLPVSEAPSSRLRIHLSSRTPTGTYRDGVILKGRKQSSTQVKSSERKVFPGSDSTQFEWSFKASRDGEINRSSLLLTDDNKTYRAYYEIYKGYSNEFSARLSMIMSDSGLILMGEAGYNHWFEDLLGWDHKYITKQRWGLSTKYFKSLTNFTVRDVGHASLSVMNADLKYRFTPGIWTGDESHGAMLSYQSAEVDVTTTKFKVPMVGVGWFWARSMPRVFDEVFNKLPFMNYPKWVDMEFIFYGLSLDSNIVLNTNFALNFHGQVLWKKNFFGEAGFGIKRYAFVDKINALQEDLGYAMNTVYGTVGIGYKF